MTVRSVCVFCGSSARVDREYLDMATSVGVVMARYGIRLVYGGASVGVMGALADAVMAGGGEVLGVIPAALDAREIAHRGVTELRVVDTMHTRKMIMADASEAFLALPGGFGTMDELFEITTWRQIELHAKPIALLDQGGYYRHMLTWIEHASREKFIPEHLHDVIEVLLDLPAVEQWLERVPPRPVDIR